MTSPKARRRQRSTRLATAAALVVLAAILVVAAIVSGSLTLVSTTALLAVLLGAAAVRITHSEVLATRRAAARDRAQQAQDYRQLAEARSVEHRDFATAMQKRLGASQTANAQLESAMVASQGRAAAAMRKLNAEARRAELAEAEGGRLAVALEESEERAAEAIVRVAELEQDNDVLRTDNDVLRAELDAAWHAPHVRHA
jgi:hypothetical protein